jgi:HEAT repeat protein
VLIGAADDENQYVRLEAGIARGAEGRAALLELAAQGWADDAVASRALQALAGHVPQDQACAILEHATSVGSRRTAVECLLALGRAGGSSAAAVLLKTLADEDVDFALAAAQALAEAGTVEAVPALRAAEERHGGSGSFGRAVRHSIAAIQARLSGASPGQVSLAQDDAGRLSISESTAGRVSLDGPVAVKEP